MASLLGVGINRASLEQMASGHDRRGFFKHLLREAAGVAQEMSSFRRDLESIGDEPESWPPPPVPASPAQGTVDEAALTTLCEEVGLKQRATDVQRLPRLIVGLARDHAGV